MLFSTYPMTKFINAHQPIMEIIMQLQMFNESNSMLMWFAQTPKLTNYVTRATLLKQIVGRLGAILPFVPEAPSVLLPNLGASTFTESSPSIYRFANALVRLNFHFYEKYFLLQLSNVIAYFIISSIVSFSTVF